MKFASALFCLTIIASSTAFVPSTATAARKSVQLWASSSDKNDESWQYHVSKILATGFMTASLWAAPAMLQNGPMIEHGPQFFPAAVANAKQMASASGSRVNKDPESLLRYGLPIQSKEVRIERVESAFKCFMRHFFPFTPFLVVTETHLFLFNIPIAGKKTAKGN